MINYDRLVDLKKKNYYVRMQDNNNSLSKYLIIIYSFFVRNCLNKNSN